MDIKPTKCENCKYWAEKSVIEKLGHCQKYAPRSTLRSPLKGTEALDTVWPRTRADDWCGEWQAKVELDEK
jgi:hypothetical protein